jgi:hypothetical protein
MDRYCKCGYKFLNADKKLRSVVSSTANSSEIIEADFCPLCGNVKNAHSTGTVSFDKNMPGWSVVSKNITENL